MKEIAKQLKSYKQHGDILRERIEKVFEEVFTGEYVTVEWTGQTQDHYDYSRNVVGPIGDAKMARFTVSANNDAHIALGENSQHNCKKYEIVIGGWGNSASVIRYGNQGASQAQDNNRILGGYDGPKSFELDWSDGESLKLSSIEAIEGKTQIRVMKCKLDPTIPINTMCVSTGWGSRGTWKVQLIEW